MSWDPDLDLEHGVLRNRLKITDPTELARVEARLTALRIAKLALDPVPGGYDLPHLQHFRATAVRPGRSSRSSPPSPVGG